MLSLRTRVESLTGLLYDAALGAVPWSEALAALHGGSSAMAGIERAAGMVLTR